MEVHSMVKIAKKKKVAGKKRRGRSLSGGPRKLSGKVKSLKEILRGR